MELSLFLLLIMLFLHYQDAASELKSEIAKKLLDLNVSAFSMAPVKVCIFNNSEISKCALIKL